MSYSLSAEIWVGVWSPSYDEEKFEDLYEFCESIGINYCVQYDSKEDYFVGIEICSASDWGSKKLNFDELKLLEEAAIEKLNSISELCGYEFETQLLPCYF